MGSESEDGVMVQMEMYSISVDGEHWTLQWLYPEEVSGQPGIVKPVEELMKGE